MRQLTEDEHERLLSIERAYRKVRDERRPYVALRRWTKTMLLNLSIPEAEAERMIIDEVEMRPEVPANAYLLRKPTNEGSVH